VADRAAARLAPRQPLPTAGFDPARLAAYLDGRFGPAALSVEPAEGGMSNPTFFVTYGTRRMVLRKQPDVTLSPSAHRIDREFKVLCALSGSDIPVPAPVLFCEDDGIVGTPFYLMERLEGEVFADSSMPGLSPEMRAGCFRAMATTLAAIHAFDWRKGGLETYGKPANFFERQIVGWTAQWRSFGITDNPALDELVAWLPGQVPAESEDGAAAAICHGDYRVANVMFDTSRAAVSGVFDWELSTIGHPLADVAFNLQPWFLAPDENGGFNGLDLAALGIPSAREYLEMYYAAAPGSQRLTRFHIAFAMFRAAVGLSGVALRNETSRDPDPVAGQQARRFAIAYARAGLESITTWDDA
jgi:aminoglycoside phosphotransferase (APT) family kinase protein